MKRRVYPQRTKNAPTPSLDHVPGCAVFSAIQLVAVEDENSETTTVTRTAKYREIVAIEKEKSFSNPVTSHGAQERISVSSLRALGERKRTLMGTAKGGVSGVIESREGVFHGFFDYFAP
jgi:hypothetical protein